MTFRALNNREELDKAVIAAQERFDRLAPLMAELQRLQSNQCAPARIGLVAMEAEVHANWIANRLAVAVRRADAMTEAGMIPARPSLPNPDLTFDAGKAEPWTVADEGRAQ